MKMAGKYASLETRENLGRVNFRKDFWDCYWLQGKEYEGYIRDFTIQRRDGNQNV